VRLTGVVEPYLVCLSMWTEGSGVAKSWQTETGKVRAQLWGQGGAITLSLLVRKFKVELLQVENKEEWWQYKQRGIQEGPDGKRSGETSGG
jgi:hypothetical protein